MFKIRIFGNNLCMKKLFAVIVVFAVLMFAYSGNKSFSLKNSTDQQFAYYVIGMALEEQYGQFINIYNIENKC